MKNKTDTVYLTIEEFLQLLQEQQISLDDISESNGNLEGTGHFSDDFDLDELFQQSQVQDELSQMEDDLFQAQAEQSCFDDDIPEYEMDMSDLDDIDSLNLLDILSNCDIISSSDNCLSFIKSGKVELFYCEY